jgi:hypothetical protein
MEPRHGDRKNEGRKVELIEDDGKETVDKEVGEVEGEVKKLL